MLLTDLMSIFKFYKVMKPIDHIQISGVEMDSRNVKSNNLFICIDGFTVDGHDFAKKAEEKGACAVLAERPLDVSIPVIIVPDTKRVLAQIADAYYEHPTHDLNLIGITGTNGKTSITYLLESIFNSDNKKTGLIGTIQMKIGNEIYPVKNTTPDALSLQKSFAKMRQVGVSTAFMEVSSHALSMGRVYGCDFDVAIFTNLTQDHLDYHETMEDYFHAKSLLFSQLGNSYRVNKPKYAIINIDDSYGQKLLKRTPQNVLTYGIDGKADIRAESVSVNSFGTAFTLVTPIGNVAIKSKLMGTFSIYNMLAATGAAICSGVNLEKIKQALESTDGVNGRFEAVRAGQSFGIIVDYAHTPDSLENVLQTVNQFVKGNVYVVIGCGGDRDRTKRPLMAKTAVRNSDYAIFTSDNPRSEEPLAIIQDMERGVEGAAFKSIVDRKQAINFAIQQASEDDIVVIAGKGHETYQVIGDRVIDFDDRDIAKECLELKLKGEG